MSTLTQMMFGKGLANVSLKFLLKKYRQIMISPLSRLLLLNKHKHSYVYGLNLQLIHSEVHSQTEYCLFLLWIAFCGNLEIQTQFLWSRSSDVCPGVPSRSVLPHLKCLVEGQLLYVRSLSRNSLNGAYFAYWKEATLIISHLSLCSRARNLSSPTKLGAFVASMRIEELIGAWESHRETESVEYSRLEGFMMLCLLLCSKSQSQW